MALEASRRLFNVTDYYRMAEAGVLGPDERVELTEGEVIAMTPIGPPTGQLRRSLDPAVRGAPW